MPRILVAPDSFKGTYDAFSVTARVAQGIRAAGGEALEAPLADGGEGTLAVLQSALGGQLQKVDVTGPLGQVVSGHFLMTDDGQTAVVETATASGLQLMPTQGRDAWRATSRGTGELISHAVAAGVREVWLGVGGSASTDGGLGAIEAISEAGGLGDVRLHVICDVRTPFELAADVFAPQKGADQGTVVRLRERLELLARTLPRNPCGVPRTGAAGGLAGGLWAVYEAELHPGIETVMEMLGFASLAASVDVVVTGEGCLDEQTREGKVVSGVTVVCQELGIPVHAIVGRCLLGREEWTTMGLTSVTEASTAEDQVSAGRALMDELFNFRS